MSRYLRIVKFLVLLILMCSILGSFRDHDIFFFGQYKREVHFSQPFLSVELGIVKLGGRMKFIHL